MTNCWDELVGLLIDVGVCSFGGDLNGFTALHGAVMSKHLSITRLSLGGSDISARSGSGMQPLHAAVEVSTEQIATLLVERGVDVNTGVEG